MQKAGQSHVVNVALKIDSTLFKHWLWYVFVIMVLSTSSTIVHITIQRHNNKNKRMLEWSTIVLNM